VSTLEKIIDAAEAYQFRYMNYADFVHPIGTDMSSKIDICAFGAVQYVVSGIAKMI
jgi:hypothetical protein